MSSFLAVPHSLCKLQSRRLFVSRYFSSYIALALCTIMHCFTIMGTRAFIRPLFIPSSRTSVF